MGNVESRNAAEPNTSTHSDAMRMSETGIKAMAYDGLIPYILSIKGGKLEGKCDTKRHRGYPRGIAASSKFAYDQLLCCQ